LSHVDDDDEEDDVSSDESEELDLKTKIMREVQCEQLFCPFLVNDDFYNLI